MSEVWRVAPTPRAQNAKAAVAALAEHQWGVVTRRQLERRGVSGTTISRWVRENRLHRVHPGVYAVGHRALRVEGRLAAALLYAGPGAMLSHTTAGWWLEICCDEPRQIHISTPRRCTSTGDLVVHSRRRLRPVTHARMPVTAADRTLLDLATVLPPAALRRALAEAEYRRLVNLEEVEALSGSGIAGSAALRSALSSHRPELARTRSVLEERFILLCETNGLPLPRLNARVCGLTVDALWEEQRVVVELDGHVAHAIAARVERDRRRELRLRAAGLTVLRYTWMQVIEQADLVVADLLAALAEGDRRRETVPVLDEADPDRGAVAGGG